MNRELSSDEVKVTAKPPERKRLEGQLVALEPLDASRHSEGLFWASHETAKAKAIWSYLPDGPFDSLRSFMEWAKHWESVSDRLFYALVEKQTERLGGMASYLDIRSDMGSIEIGYIWFAPFLQRTRQATEALFLLLRHAFDDLAYRRVQWRCNALNERSRAAAARLGFRYEGIFYQHMIVKGNNRDTAWYSMLDWEWPQVRGNLESWLSPSNFDDDGKQKRPLTRLP